MADVRDDFVVVARFYARGAGTEGLPEFQDARRGGRCGVRERCHETRAALKKFGRSVFPASFFRTSHRMRADKMRVRTKSGGAQASNFLFHTAHIGHDCASGEVGGDLADQGNDLVNRGGDHNEAGPSDRGFGGLGYCVAPRLAD